MHNWIICTISHDKWNSCLFWRGEGEIRRWGGGPLKTTTEFTISGWKMLVDSRGEAASVISFIKKLSMRDEFTRENLSKGKQVRRTSRNLKDKVKLYSRAFFSFSRIPDCFPPSVYIHNATPLTCRESVSFVIIISRNRLLRYNYFSSLCLGFD